jgi:hypothetical protein
MRDFFHSQPHDGMTENKVGDTNGQEYEIKWRICVTLRPEVPYNGNINAGGPSTSQNLIPTDKGKTFILHSTLHYFGQAKNYKNNETEKQWQLYHEKKVF